MKDRERENDTGPATPSPPHAAEALPTRPDEEAILLEDLAPRRDVRGGRKLLFGEEGAPPGSSSH